ncbi:MAG: beta-ketoacyl synthase chain length factor [Gammaproteobacteria bacterium]|nr:beta-ketoacyl synthase chain length factor [Gammaproteobacteria bacterium]MDH3465199.1 beta-ketoacyl synthase chain length factor [Gammaproteobacteria bacterium]
MQFNVLGTGLWGPGFCDWASYVDLLGNVENVPTEAPATLSPKPDIIPPRERRRSPLYVRIAVEVATQACKEARLSPADIACVFASGMGDLEITDYMCRTLATDPKLLSPTKFHNSVHNAAAGYWSISTGCQQPVSSVSGFDFTAPVALLEAGVFSSAEQRPVLLVMFDISTPATFDNFFPIDEAFAAAMVLAPSSIAPRENAINTRVLTISRTSGSAQWPALELPEQCKFLHTLYTTNPSARILTLLDQIRRGDSSPIQMPMGKDAVLSLSLSR